MSIDMTWHRYKITTPRLILRTPEAPDAFDLMQCFSNTLRVDWFVLSETSVEKMLDWIQGWQEGTQAWASGFMVIILRETNEIIGCGGLNQLVTTDPFGSKPTWELRKCPMDGGPHVFAADLGISIDVRHRRQGYAREAVCAWIEFSFDQLPCGYAHFDTQSFNHDCQALMKNVLGLDGVRGDGSAAKEDAAFRNASASTQISYDIDTTAWASRKDELKRIGIWPL